MTKLRNLISLALAVALVAIPSTSAFAQLNNKAGRLNTRDYAVGFNGVDGYVLSSAVAAASASTQVVRQGTFSISPRVNDCIFTALNGRKAQAMVNNGVYNVLDGTLTESVTLTAVTTSNGICTITATFTNAHAAGTLIVSGDNGLSIAQADAAGQGGFLVVDSDSNITEPMITALVPYPNVGIEDNRGGYSQYWNVTPGATTALATPAALTAQAACDATHTTCSDSSVAGSASWGGTVHCGVSYVDVLGNESLTSADASWTSVASKAIDIGAPAASTGAVGYKPYCSLSGGTYALMYSLPLLTQPTVLGAVPAPTGVCTLTTIETITPACALVNTKYNQVSSNAVFTGFPVVTSELAPNLDSASAQSLNPSNGGVTIYKYAPSNHPNYNFQSQFMSFPITTAAQTTIGQVAGSIPLRPGFLNYPGRTVEVCGMLSKTSTNADTITNIQLWWDAEGSNVTTGQPIELSNIQVTSTNTAAATYSFCQDITTTVAAAGATGATITPGMGWLTQGQVAAGTVPVGATNILFAAVGSLNLALNGKLEVVYNHSTGTDGAGVILLNPTVKIIN